MNLEVFCILCYVTLLTREVMCEEFSRCYSDIDSCFWTDGSWLSKSAAETACRQRNGAFLPRVINSTVQSKLEDFRNATSNLQSVNGFWIDLTAVDGNWSWIDGTPFSGKLYGQSDGWARFGVIIYDWGNREHMFYARGYDYDYNPRHVICQLQQGPGCRPTSGDLSIYSKCYRKVDTKVDVGYRGISWFDAINNYCLHGNQSLAVFADIERPSDNIELTNWLGPSYWIGLVKQWWITTDKDGRSVDLRYSNWRGGYPKHTNTKICVLFTQWNTWLNFECNQQFAYVCQNYSRYVPSMKTPKTLTATTTTTTTKRTSLARKNDSLTSSSTKSDEIIVMAIAIGVPCITVCVVALVLYKCYKIRHRDSNESADTQRQGRQGEQPPYEEIALDRTESHDSHPYNACRQSDN